MLGGWWAGRKGRTPCCAAADGGAVEREDEDFFVVDHGAKEFGGLTYVSTVFGHIIRA